MDIKMTRASNFDSSLLRQQLLFYVRGMWFGARCVDGVRRGIGEEYGNNKDGSNKETAEE
jgi:hypothetical protein